MLPAVRTFWITFAVWSVLLTALTVIVNLPTRQLRRVMEMQSGVNVTLAGWPFPYAAWQENKLVLLGERFLAANISLAILTIPILSYACASARRVRREEREILEWNHSDSAHQA